MSRIRISSGIEHLVVDQVKGDGGLEMKRDGGSEIKGDMFKGKKFFRSLSSIRISSGIEHLEVDQIK
jgi:hypothetical protein